MIKFNQPDWSKNPELGVIDSILEQDATLLELLAKDISVGTKRKYFGQKYISKVKKEPLQAFLVELDKVAIKVGLKDLNSIRPDSTVVESNIHYPTNRSLVLDCIKEAHRLLSQLAEKEGIKVRDYRKAAKSNHFKINNSMSDKRVVLFVNQLKIFTQSINQVSISLSKKRLQDN